MSEKKSKGKHFAEEEHSKEKERPMEETCSADAAQPLMFGNREEFRKWLSGNCLSASGVWLLFGKTGGSKTIKAGEALEEALCFGWIDGQMQSIDDKTYRKYFSMRREKIFLASASVYQQHCTAAANHFYS